MVLNKVKESTGIQIVLLFFIVLSIVILILWYISLRIPIFEQDGNLTNSATITIEIAIGLFIAISILIAERNWQGKITDLIKKSEIVLTNQEKDRERRIDYAFSRLKRELDVMENWVSVTNGYIDDYTKTKKDPTGKEEYLEGLVSWLKVMDGVRNENIRALENIDEFSKEVFDYEDLDDIETLINIGRSFYIPHQLKELALPLHLRDETTLEIQETIQRLRERINILSDSDKNETSHQ